MFKNLYAIPAPKKSGIGEFTILIKFRHLDKDRDETAVFESGLKRIVACNFFSSGSLFPTRECHVAPYPVHFNIDLGS